MNVFDIREFGAAGNGRDKDTTAVQRAMDSCSEKGGGVVYCPPETYLCGSVLLKTGLRKGEALNLRWEDIDFEPQRIRMAPRASWTPKGRRGREVPCDEHVGRGLPSLPRTSEYVLTNRTEGQLRYHLYEKFARVVKRAGLEGVTLHTLRHSTEYRVMPSSA